MGKLGLKVCSDQLKTVKPHCSAILERFLTFKSSFRASNQLKAESQPTCRNTVHLLIANVCQTVKTAFLDVANVSASKMPKSIFMRATISLEQPLNRATLALAACFSIDRRSPRRNDSGSLIFEFDETSKLIRSNTARQTSLRS